MNANEAKDIMDSLFPVGEKRWVEVEYLDRDKCIKAFGHPANQDPVLVEKHGYRTHQLTIVPQFNPQVTALMELRESIIPLLVMRFEDSEDHTIKNVREFFEDKIKAVSERSIKQVKDL